jgi:hypothetical protein
VVGADRVDQAVAQRLPHSVDVFLLAQWRLTDPERRVRPLKALAREIEIERPRLAVHA